MVYYLIPAIAKYMLSRSFSKISFTFKPLSWQELGVEELKGFGLYLHVPFCRMFCLYCPFYKVRFDEILKRKYVDSVKREVKLRGLRGNARWLYIGGGTPNLLKAEEICDILTRFREFIELKDVGMEGNPFEFTLEYLEKIGDVGVTKISMGVETFQSDTLKAVRRARANEQLVERVVDGAQKLGISVNVDLMVGLPGQSFEGCLRDVEILANISPDQITIYPYILIPGVIAEPGMNSKTMFKIIESVWEILKEYGYRRDSVWVFAKGHRIYDSAKDELVSDYFGLGPAAFSLCGNIQTVNPPIELYLYTLQDDKRLAFYTELDKNAKSWRTFAYGLYRLQLDPPIFSKLPLNIKMVLQILRMTGYAKGFNVTDKGRYLVHEIIKTVVETLPYPINNPKSVKNYSEYEEYLKNIKVLTNHNEPPTSYADEFSDISKVPV